MTPERILEIEQTCELFGSSNGWTGTSGKLATMIRELLVEVRRLESATTGWSGYGWKDGEYIDDIQSFFDGQ